ncbi:MAG: 16S rRNA (cytosine(1402)-N(4))-methyltransferase RsmH [Bdellovibrionaceae bacterium]|nr:16S rRNA (cytosine(1402)-N(4))-methyltransferase RsmH [Pseudobdellovibrionaceae bacterium]
MCYCVFMPQNQGHIPIMKQEILDFIKESSVSASFLLDATFGRGGHTQYYLDYFKDLKVLACDRDKEAIKYGKAHLASFLQEKRLDFIYKNFKDISAQDFSRLSETACSHILVDLGVSSPQLDKPERGFSFYKKGPLDMRMDQNQELTAADIINTWSEEKLIELFQKNGEVFRPYRVVRAIVEDRKHQLFNDTLSLAQLIERVDSWQKKSFHPATKYFMALRMEVNGELSGLKESLEAFVDYLCPGGRLIVLSFHSLEDRIVKHLFKALKDKGNILTKKIVKASDAEKKINPRSRSAKLRVFEKAL